MSVVDDQSEISWNKELEDLIGGEGEKCAGLAWIYRESEQYYSNRNNFIALPVIVLSTLTGFISGSSQLIFTNPDTSSIGIGAVSLFTGVLSTIGSYFSWAKKAESCRISAIQYSKLHKFITVELTLPKVERIRAKDMLKMIRETVERLSETSPAIPPKILEMYERKVEKGKIDVAHPEIVVGVAPVVINRNTYDDHVDPHAVKKVEVKDEKTQEIKIGVVI
jgi:hypothetical protein